MAKISVRAGGNPDVAFVFDGEFLPVKQITEALVDIPSGQVCGRYKAEGSVTIDQEHWRSFMGALPIPPVAKYQAAQGTLYVSGSSDLKVSTSDGLSFTGTPWFDIGTTRGPEGTNRLRKFVRRAGRLVEVRTRGRTGVRSLAAAVEQAISQTESAS